MSDFNFIPTIDDINKKLVDLATDTVKAVLCTAAYVADPSDHLLSAIPSGARLSTVTLSGKSFVNGVFDADDVIFTGMSMGDVVTQVIVYAADGASPEGGRLLRRGSSATYANFPNVTNGKDIHLKWPNDGNKIFAYLNR